LKMKNLPSKIKQGVKRLSAINIWTAFLHPACNKITSKVLRLTINNNHCQLREQILELKRVNRKRYLLQMIIRGTNSWKWWTKFNQCNRQIGLK
jgi:hypothetical protein